jgi:hypothetical protein
LPAATLLETLIVVELHQSSALLIERRLLYPDTLTDLRRIQPDLRYIMLMRPDMLWSDLPLMDYLCAEFLTIPFAPDELLNALIAVLR